MDALPGGRDRCLFVHCCVCLAAGEVAKRSGGHYAVDCCCAGVAGMYIGFYPLCWGWTRAQLRGNFGIPGNLCMDVLITGVFPCCYLSQALNQLDLAEGISASAPRMPELMRCSYSVSSRGKGGLPAPLSATFAASAGADKAPVVAAPPAPLSPAAVAV